MDTPAELTLQLARLVQEQHAQKAMVGWFFVPEWREATWEQAREILAAAPKPLVIAVLTEPGYLAIWSIERIPSAQRTGVEHHLDNTGQYFAEKLQLCRLRDVDSLVLQMPGGTFDISVADFRQWTHDYAVSLGVTIQTTPTPHVGRILVRPPGGGRPLGLPDGEA